MISRTANRKKPSNNTKSQYGESYPPDNEFLGGKLSEQGSLRKLNGVPMLPSEVDKADNAESAKISGVVEDTKGRCQERSGRTPPVVRSAKSAYPENSEKCQLRDAEGGSRTPTPIKGGRF